MRFGSVRLCSLFSVIIAVLMLLSVSVHPALAASLVNEQIETSVTELGELTELTDLNDLSDMAIIQDNQISSVTLDEIDLDTTKDLSTAPTSSVANTFLAPSSAATDGDDEMMYIDRGLVHIHARDPLSDQSSDSSSLQSQLAGISVLPQESPVLAVPSDDVELSRIVSNLTDDGYIFTGMSAHQYQSTVTSEKFRSLNRDQLAVAGIQVSDTSSSTITAREDVTYYTFTNPTTESARVVTAAQLIGADGVSLIGDRKVVVSPIVEKSAMDSQRGDNTEDFASWILDFAMMCPGVAVIPLPAEIGIAAIVGIILLIIYFCTRDSPPSPAPQTTIVQFGNPSAFTHQPSYNDYTRIGGDSAIRRTGELETYRGTGPTGKDWIQATRHAAITRDGNLVTWSDRQQEPTTVVAPGKKYVAVSQYSDWLLAIYEDTTGLTHVEPLANPMAPPSEIRNAVPTETGWKKISAGPTHALALRADDTLVAWGQNDYGQLNLPSDLHYTDIAAGSRFSIGLTTETRGWPSREGGTILAAGNDDNHQVSDAPKETDYYLKIAAGNNTAATLTRDGHIKLWGQPLDGAAPPTDGGCTDIAIGSDSGFALQEIAPEKQIDEPVGLSSSGDALIPYGSTIERSDNTVTRVIDPKGSVAFWVNDKSATHIRFPAGAVVPVTRVHYVPSHSIVDGRQNYTATVVSPPPTEEGARSNPTGDSPSLTVTETAWYDDLNPDNPQTLPRAMCFADTGCSVGVTTKQHLFLSDNPIHPSTDDIPSLSVHQLSNTSWIGTISANNQDRSIVMEKNHASPDQPLYFSIISSNGGYEPGQNMVLSAKANMTSENATLRYAVTGISSSDLAMYITPNIWKITDTSDVLVYSGPPVTCLDATFCAATGTFTPHEVANYFTNATVLYTLPIRADGAAGTQQYAMVPASAGATSGAGNQATDIAGRTITQSDVKYAADYQKSMNYNPTTYYDAKKEDVKTRLPHDEIFFFSGHGLPGMIQINESTIGSSVNALFYAKGDEYSFEKTSNSYSTMKLAVFLGCQTGKNSDRYGNLVDSVTSKSASCAIGWTDNIVSEGTGPWTRSFWTALYNGKTILQAHDDGKQAAKDDPTCKSLIPPEKWQYCMLDKLYYQGSGCNQALPSAASRQVESRDPEWIVPTDMQLLQERQAIITFSGNEKLNPVFKESIKYTYGELDIFGENNTIYKVNRNTGRIQSMYISSIDLMPSTNSLSLDQGYLIAETYAKKKYPDLWENTPTVIIRSTNTTTHDSGLAYSWRQYINATIAPSNRSSDNIAGYNLVDVTLDPRDGSVRSYHEWYMPLDKDLNLNPDLSEENAWGYAKKFFEMSGAAMSGIVNKKDLGLAIATDEKNRQHLTWQFEIQENPISGLSRGGQVGIDAHNGQVVWYATIG